MSRPLMPRALSLGFLAVAIGSGFWWASMLSKPAAPLWLVDAEPLNAEVMAPALKGRPPANPIVTSTTVVPPEPGAVGERRKLSGRTLDPTGGIVPGVVLYTSLGEGVRSTAQLETTCSSMAGEYRLDIPFGSSFGIIALRDGYRPLFVEGICFGDDEREVHRDFVLDAGVSIQGRVLDLDGWPVPDALVFAEPPGADPALRSSTALPGRRGVDAYRSVARTKGDGTFQIGGLQAGLHYSLQARKRGWIPAWQQVDGRDVIAPRDNLELAMEGTFVCRIEFVSEGTDRPIPGVHLETLGAPNLLPSTLTNDWLKVDAGEFLGDLDRRGQSELYARLDTQAVGSVDGRTKRAIASAPGYADRAFTLEFVPSGGSVTFRRIELRPLATNFGRVKIEVFRGGDGAYTGPMALVMRLADGSTWMESYVFVKAGMCPPLPVSIPTGATRIEPMDGRASRLVDGSFEPIDFTVHPDEESTIRIGLHDRGDRGRLIVLLVDPKGHPAPGATVMVQGLLPAGGGSYTLFHGETNSDYSSMHRHVFSLEPGRCLVRASRRGYEHSSVSTDLVAGNTTTVRLTLLAVRKK